MEYSFSRGATGYIIAVCGRVDESTWAAFGAGLSDALRKARDASANQMTIDLAKLDYMSSRGLRVLTVAKREADEFGITLTLAAPNEVMREILAISRYDKLFTITDNIDAD